MEKPRVQTDDQVITGAINALDEIASRCCEDGACYWKTCLCHDVVYPTMTKLAKMLDEF